jgi:DNA polymerase-1
MNVLLIDGDIFAYWASFGVERAIMLDENTMTYDCDLDDAKEKVEDLLTETQEALKSDRIVLTLSDDANNFRKELSDQYKLPRTTTRKPLALKPIRDYLAKKYDAKIKYSLEADDVLGILATHPKIDADKKKVIVSSDKDLLQIPGRHFNPKTGAKRMISGEVADRHFYLQVLTGDTTDNYPGCPGIGVKRAPALLNMEEPWPSIVKAYEKKKLTEEDALLQARLARILRFENYDFKKKEPILWTP